MGSVGDAYDNALIESFFGTLQLELLDRRKWETRHALAQAPSGGHRGGSLHRRAPHE
jgi:putative transposase